ncbi:tRNA 4-thiouridine(8) synthase ThiI [Candidatus Micrarchaeota archaeon]|nr:tRNA 4-thiouridine(8) synthase ThiI [Candidatus Micrarchaeota archaeon]MBU1165971.1 tRNA 4-thiouridine(8) synthase ThiI [Candidatus Micrarchaeota archaeon]MBU1886875.1 tRNA 4-thiouridine(8) synthase ThiI [Candidatus Micrarchaeota archaeon]
MLNIHCSEILLKGKNQRFFEDILLGNIKSALSEFGDVRPVSKRGRILVSVSDEVRAKQKLMSVFGVDSILISVKCDREHIIEKVLSMADSFKGKSIRVHTKRCDKRFNLTSQQVNQIVGKALVEHGCSVDLDNPEHTVFIEILGDCALISFEKTKCFGGLPVGSSGPVLSLLSGGIDSPVSSWMMMKRGCSVDFMHMHQFSSAKQPEISKIKDLVSAILPYSPVKMRLYLMPYVEFYKKSLSINQKNELVIFRRFLLRIANKLAEKHGYRGLVTGDSLGQVASQTLDNLFVTNEVSHYPVFRPLIAFNKQEIIDLAEKIGTYKISIQEYKDCCSLVAYKNPSTKAKLDFVKSTEDKIDIDGIVDKTLNLCEIIDI